MLLTVILFLIYTLSDVTHATGQCHLDHSTATVTTFDSLSYGASAAGYYMMMRNRRDGVYVDVLMNSSGPETVSCAVAVKHHINRLTYINIIDVCDEYLTVLRCHSDDLGLVILNENVYEIRTITGDVVVTFTYLGNSADITVTVPVTHQYECDGLCGNYNGDPSDDMGFMPLPDFLEYNRYSDFTDSNFYCTNYYPVVPGPISCPGCCKATGTRQIVTFDQHSYTMSPSTIYNLASLNFENVFIDVNTTSATNCALGLRSGSHFTSEGDRGEKVIFSICDGTMKVLKCQDEQTKPITLDSNGYYETSDYDGHVSVKVKESGSGFVIYVMRSEDTYPPSGLCGNADGDATNEYSNVDVFLEQNSVDYDTSVFNCVVYKDADVVPSV